MFEITIGCDQHGLIIRILNKKLIVLYTIFLSDNYFIKTTFLSHCTWKKEKDFL